MTNEIDFYIRSDNNNNSIFILSFHRKPLAAKHNEQRNIDHTQKELSIEKKIPREYDERTR